MSSPVRKEFLFLPVHGYAKNRQQHRSLDSKVRHHLMVGIGKARRKPTRVTPYVTLVWQSTAAKEQQPVPDLEQDVTHGAIKENKTRRSTTPANAHALELTAAPVVRMLSVFEKEWGEDWFSAYGFSLLMMSAQNVGSAARSSNVFWFPFAFKSSPFMQHYHSFFTSTHFLESVSRSGVKELKALALDRSVVTIRCIEGTLAMADNSSSTSQRLINGILALICYNLTSLDFAQAMLHLRGIQQIIAARGGITTLDATHNLLFRISSIDITIALLFDTKPLFPQPLGTEIETSSSIHESSSPFRIPIERGGVERLPWMTVTLEVDKLHKLAMILKVEMAAKGDAMWLEQERIDSLVNPIAHNLLKAQAGKSSIELTQLDALAEVVRIGAILWLIEVKRCCRSYPGNTKGYVSTLLSKLGDRTMEWLWIETELEPVRLWLCMLCSLSEPGRNNLAVATRMIAGSVGVVSDERWDEIMAGVRKMPWLDVFEARIVGLRLRLCIW